MTKLASGKTLPRVTDAAMLDAIDSFPSSMRAWHKTDGNAEWRRFSKDIDTIEAWCRQHGMKSKQWKEFQRDLINGYAALYNGHLTQGVKPKMMLAKLKLKVKANKERQDSVCSKCGQKLPTQKMLSSGFRCGRRK